MSLRALDRILIDGTKLDASIARVVTSAVEVRTMEGAASVEITVRDRDRQLLEPGLLSRPTKARKAERGRLANAAWERFGSVRLVLDGIFFRLAGAHGQVGGDVTLVFESEVATLLRAKKGPWKMSRADATRAEAASILAKRVKSVDVPFYSPEMGKKQPIERVPKEDRREKGIARGAKLTIKGRPIDSHQRRVLEQALGVAEDERAPELAYLALLCAIIVESEARNLRHGDRDSEGVLQLRVGLHGRAAARSVERSVRLFLTEGFTGRGGAIELARKGDLKPGEIAQAVQGSAFPSRYQQQINEAKEILDAWGGAGVTVTQRKSYAFKVERGQDSWEAMGDWAREVNWRRFADNNVLYFVSDETLMRSRPRMLLRPNDPAVVEEPRFDVDVGHPVSEVTFSAQMDRTAAPPGAVVELLDNGFLDGRWLVRESRRDLLSPFGVTEVTLHRPEPQLKEPASEVVVVSQGSVEGGALRDRIVEVAKKTLTTRTGFSRYSQAGALTADPTPRAPARSDCSQWIRAVYLKAGAPDPGTWTGAMAQKGKRTRSPKPGDIMLTAGTDHCELYVGREGIAGKNTIGHGTAPIDYAHTSYFPGHYFVTYDFLDSDD